MSHKTKEDRQRDAALRKRKYLPSKENALIEVLRAKSSYAPSYLRTALSDAAYALLRAYEEAGHPDAEAEGMVRFILKHGTTGGWLSGPTIEEAIDQAMQ